MNLEHENQLYQQYTSKLLLNSHIALISAVMENKIS